jgi:hypothetical protein
VSYLIIFGFILCKKLRGNCKWTNSIATFYTGLQSRETRGRYNTSCKSKNFPVPKYHTTNDYRVSEDNASRILNPSLNGDELHVPVILLPVKVLPVSAL